MVKVYAELVLRGQKTVEEVPEKWRAQVQAYLAAIGR